MTILITALLLGLMGSMHCAGMCGPLALSLPLRGTSILQKCWGGILWSLGRIVTYGLMGALFGMIGAGFRMIGFQQIISVVMGVLMILSIILPSIFKKYTSGAAAHLLNPVRRGMQHLFREKNNKALFLIGIFNGLLPCGLIYLAIAGAIGTSALLPAIGYMVLFGIGTIPMLLGIAIMGNMVSRSFRMQIYKIIPYIVILVGIIFILRGLTLGIPFLSPPKEKLSPSMHMKVDNAGVAKAVENSCCHPDTAKTNPKQRKKDKG